MFDWARGSVLKQFVREQLMGATSYAIPVKGWENGWVPALLDVPPGVRLLDVGSGNNPWYAQCFADRGCETHVLEQLNRPDMPTQFGLTRDVIDAHPAVTFHLGLLGQEIAPAGYFDIITCISVMEHLYDSDSPMNPDNPVPHFDALRDLVRMLAPGGVLVLTYGVFLNDSVPWHHGWDYLADIAFLERSGMSLLYSKKPVRSRVHIYNHEDTLFYDPEMVFAFADEFWRETAVGMMFRKQGPVGPVTLAPRTNLVDVLFHDVRDRDFSLRGGGDSGVKPDITATAESLARIKNRIRLSGVTRKVTELEAELAAKEEQIAYLTKALRRRAPRGSRLLSKIWRQFRSRW